MNERHRQRGWCVKDAPVSLPLPRFVEQVIQHDPLEIMFAQREAKEEHARAQVAKGHTPDADPADLRGIPVIARGVGGTSPGTNPASAVLRLDAR